MIIGSGERMEIGQKHNYWSDSQLNFREQIGIVVRVATRDEWEQEYKMQDPKGYEESVTILNELIEDGYTPYFYEIATDQEVQNEVV